MTDVMVGGYRYSLLTYSISLMRQAKSVAKWKKELLRKELYEVVFQRVKVIN